MAEELKQGEATAPRIKLSEIGTTGLAISNDQIVEEIKRELRWPRSIQVYKTMSYDPLIYSALQLFEMLIGRVDWEVVAPEDATEEQKRKTEFIKQCMNDMDHTWRDFIKDVLSYITYGFSVHEKVYRRRTFAAGSKYNDNLIGWRKLAVRSQDTISGWNFSPDGRSLTGVEQDLSMVSSNYNNDFTERFRLENKDGVIHIPREKFMLFRYNGKRNNPEGSSPLKHVYLSWRYRTEIIDQEAIGISRDLKGLPHMRIPADYLSPNADKEKKAAADAFYNIGRNIHNNEQSCVVTPSDRDEKGNLLFDFSLVSSQGSKNYETDAIIRRHSNEILQALFADILKLGNDSQGSYALADSKSGLVNMAVEARLKEIADVINHDLIPQTFRLNKWDDKEFPEIKFKHVEKVDEDLFSKFIQRTGSVQYLPRSKELINEILDKSGWNYRVPEDMSDEDFEMLFPANRSRAGDGMKTGTGDGTSTNPFGNGDNDTDNQES